MAENIEGTDGAEREVGQEGQEPQVKFYEPAYGAAKAVYVNIVRVRTNPPDQTLELTFGYVDKPVLEEDLWIWPEHRIVMTAKVFLDLYRVMDAVVAGVNPVKE